MEYDDGKNDTSSSNFVDKNLVTVDIESLNEAQNDNIDQIDTKAIVSTVLEKEIEECPDGTFYLKDSKTCGTCP